MYLGFFEREYLRMKFKGRIKRAKNQMYLGFFEREYLRMKFKGRIKRAKNQMYLGFFEREYLVSERNIVKDTKNFSIFYLISEQMFYSSNACINIVFFSLFYLYLCTRKIN